MDRRIGALVDRVRSVRIGHHRKLLVLLDELVDQQLDRLVVTVVVAGSMNDQQVTLQVFREMDRRTIVVARWVIFGDALITFLIDGIIVPHVRHRRDGYARMIYVGVLEHRIQRHRTTTAPTPDANAVLIQPRCAGR